MNERWLSREVQELYGRSHEIRHRYDAYLFAREEKIAKAPTLEDVDVKQGLRDIMIKE